MLTYNLKMFLKYQLKLQEDFKTIMVLLNKRSDFYKKKRRQHLTYILGARNRRMNLLKQIMSRTVWTKNRSTVFWEKDVANNNNDFFKENFRMSRESFNILCRELRGLQKLDTNYRKSIPLRKRIAIALYALGSSAEYRSIANLFGVGKCMVGKILIEFCQEMWSVLAPTYLSAYPLTEEKVIENVNGFQKLGFPQCFGAIDGCHIEVRPQADDAVDYYNYKGWYSTVLLAVVDYRYRFLYVNVGSPGRCNDSQIFENSSLKTEHESPILRTMSRNLCGVDVPVVLIGDSAFRFSDILMKPYPYNTSATVDEKRFNYMLSKSRRVVENAFGHLKARFRRIGKGLDNRIDNTSLIIKTCCVLHNFLNVQSDDINNQWLRTENVTQREQPESTIQISDGNPTAAIIREAITRFLAFEEIDSAAPVFENESEEVEDPLESLVMEISR